LREKKVRLGEVSLVLLYGLTNTLKLYKWKKIVIYVLKDLALIDIPYGVSF